MPVSYDFKRASRETPRRTTRGKRLRFFVLLCVVAAVTAGVMMLIVPGKTPEKNGSTNTNTENPTENNPETSPDGRGNSTQISGKNNSGSDDDITTNIDIENEPKSGKSGKNGKSSSSDNSGKGVVRSDDLPLDADQPEFRPGQAPGLTETLTKAAALSDIDAQVAVFREFLMKEYSAGGEFSANWNAVGMELASAIRAKWNSRQWKKDSITYKVVARDHLTKISNRNNSTVEGIKFINQRKNNFLRIGERLTVIPGPWRVSISRKARLLNLWRKEKDAWRIFAVFPVGVGRKNRTPNGSFIINHRLRHPKWYGPDGRVFAYGDKENPLGDYFLKLRQVEPGGAKKDRGYGIHGSSDDSSVGRSLSNGCIRMRNQDVEILYYLLPGGCPVKIVD